jgi:hypothetical protein
MRAKRRFLIIVLGLASACMPAGVFGEDDLAGLLEQKRPGTKGIITKPSIFRERKLTRLPLSAGQAEFLIDHLRVSLALAHLYAPFLDKYRIEVRPDAVIHIDDPGRLAGDADLIDARAGRRVYLIAGYFNVFKMRFNGHMVLKTVYSNQQENASVSVDATATAYIKLDSVVGSAFARLADYLFPGKVDERIERFLRAAERIADAVHKDPAGAYGRLASAGEVSEEELEEFGRTFLRDSERP